MIFCAATLGVTIVVVGFVYRFCKYYFQQPEKYELNTNENTVRPTVIPNLTKTTSSCDSTSDSERSSGFEDGSRNNSYDTHTVQQPRRFKPFKTSFSRERRQRATSVTPSCSSKAELVSQLSSVSVISIPEFIPENLNPATLDDQIENSRMSLVIGPNAIGSKQLPPLGSPQQVSKNNSLPIVVTMNSTRVTSSEDDHF